MANTKDTPNKDDPGTVVNPGPSKEAKSGAPMADDGTKMTTEDTPKAVKSKVTMDEKTILQAKAIELNIEVDPDWDENRLRGEIQMAREGRADLQVKGAIPGADMGDPNFDSATKSDKDTEVLLSHDYWPEADQRVAAGTKLKVSRDKAVELINAGKANRTDPLR